MNDTSDASDNPALVSANTPDRFQTPLVRNVVALVHAKIHAFPYGSSEETMLAEAMRRHQVQREWAFFDELDRADVALTADEIQSSDFLHAFMASLRAVYRTRHEEKVRMFARLFANYAQGDMAAAADEQDANETGCDHPLS